jgi:hypothetical protein
MRRLLKPGNVCGDGHYIRQFSVDPRIREGPSLALLAE